MSQPGIREVSIRVSSPGEEKADVLVLPVFKGALRLPQGFGEILGALGESAGALFGSEDYRGDLGEAVVLYGAGGPYARLMILGLGERADLNRERLRSASASGARKARDLGVGSVFMIPPPDGTASLTTSTAETLSLPEQVELMIEGACLGAYQFPDYKTVGLEKYKSVGELSCLLPKGANAKAARAACARGKVRADAVNWARDLANTPANLLTPTILADRAETMAREEGLRFRRLDRTECERIGLNAFLSVARGSTEPPWFLILEYPGTDPTAPPFALVGKGLTFDAGGISLKPALNMHEMKYDMCGAAAVLGAMKSLRALDVSVPVVAVIPATENLPGGRATKPGDLVRSFFGKTIEILNTDAEGRLILADALSYVAQNHQPRAIIDLATLTGAVLYALGHYGAALLSTDDELSRRIEAAAQRSGERVWRLPLWEEFPEHLKGDVADLKNIGDATASAGTIAGGAFLREFVGDTPWAHIDIAGTAWWERDRPLLPKGPTGYGVRLLCDLLAAPDAGSAFLKQPGS